jgi:hypothetical protein
VLYICIWLDYALKSFGVSVVSFKEVMDIVDLKRDIELLSERLGKTQDYL